MTETARRLRRLAPQRARARFAMVLAGFGRRWQRPRWGSPSPAFRDRPGVALIW